MAAPGIGDRRRLTPPVTARVNWSHPLAQGLRFWANPAAGADIVRGYPGTISGGASPSSRGGIEFSDASGQITYGQANGGLLSSGSEWSAVVQFNMGTLADKWFIGKRQGFSPGNSEFGFGTGGGGSSANVQRKDGFVNIAGVFSANTSYIAGASISASTVNIYTNGNLAGSAASDMRADTGPTATLSVGRRADEGGDGFTTGSIQWAAVWARALSAAEMAQVYADPFCMLRR